MTLLMKITNVQRLHKHLRHALHRAVRAKHAKRATPEDKVKYGRAEQLIMDALNSLS